MATRIHMSNGDHLDVDENFGEVQNALTSPPQRLVQFTGHRRRAVLVNPDHVAYVASAP